MADEIAAGYPPLKIAEYVIVRLLKLCDHSPIQSVSALNKMQTDQQSVALIIGAPSEGGRLPGWISTPLA